MKRWLLGVFVALTVCALSTLIGLTVFTAAGTVGIGGNYDMPPTQTEKFVTAAANKLGGKPGPEASTYKIPVLPWSSVTIKATVTPKSTGSHVELYGHATKAKELKQLLDRQLPPFSGQ
jgi:hypothetical protein